MTFLYNKYASENGRSREGAWIEIIMNKSEMKTLAVAPVRERGLKYYHILPAVVQYKSLP